MRMPAPGGLTLPEPRNRTFQFCGGPMDRSGVGSRQWESLQGFRYEPRCDGCLKVINPQFLIARRLGSGFCVSGVPPLSSTSNVASVSTSECLGQLLLRDGNMWRGETVEHRSNERRVRTFLAVRIHSPGRSSLDARTSKRVVHRISNRPT